MESHLLALRAFKHTPTAVAPTIELLPLLLQNCDSATVVNCNEISISRWPKASPERGSFDTPNGVMTQGLKTAKAQQREVKGLGPHI